jgi:hypothetical protein
MVWPKGGQVALDRDQIEPLGVHVRSDRAPPRWTERTLLPQMRLMHSVSIKFHELTDTLMIGIECCDVFETDCPFCSPWRCPITSYMYPQWLWQLPTRQWKIHQTICRLTMRLTTCSIQASSGHPVFHISKLLLSSHICKNGIISKGSSHKSVIVITLIYAIPIVSNDKVNQILIFPIF